MDGELHRCRRVCCARFPAQPARRRALSPARPLCGKIFSIQHPDGLGKIMDCLPTNAGKSAMASASRLWWQVACVLLLGLVCGVAGAQQVTYNMRVGLNTNTPILIPVQDPYCTDVPAEFLGTRARFTSGADKRCTVVTVPEIPPIIDSSPDRGIVDWVLVELRETSGNADSANRDTVIARKPAFLLSNGRIVDAEDYAGLASPDPNNCTTDDAGNLLGSDACPDVEFEVAVNENLYVVVRHRNHLGVMSANPVVADARGAYVHDFAAGVNQARGGARAQKTFLHSGDNRQEIDIPVMACGDLNGDGIVQQTDISVILFGDLLLRGYRTSDLNMDGQVNSSDFLIFGQGSLQRRSLIPES